MQYIYIKNVLATNDLTTVLLRTTLTRKMKNNKNGTGLAKKLKFRKFHDNFFFKTI